MQTFAFILGRLPELSLEELLVVLSPLGHISEVTTGFLIFQGSIDPVALLPRLGGTIKIAVVQETLDAPQQLSTERWLHLLRPELNQAKGKFQFGASVYGPKDVVRHVQGTGLALKKHLKTLPVSSRFVWNNDGHLSSVAVRKNNLIGREVLVLCGTKCYVALTAAVQDFDSYGARDYGRPSRNMQRGMLPPKLAQIMLNMGEARSSDSILDPFCGTGTVLQEALLMGIGSVWGTDRDPKAIEEAQMNADWLSAKFGVRKPTLAVQDVQDISRVFAPGFFDLVVTEPFLGPARFLMRSSLTRKDVASVVADTSRLYQILFRSIAPVVRPGGRLVVVSPVFRLLGEEYATGSFDSFRSCGWRLKEPLLTKHLKHAQLSSRGQILYDREDQIVARELSVWQRIE